MLSYWLKYNNWALFTTNLMLTPLMQKSIIIIMIINFNTFNPFLQLLIILTLTGRLTFY